MAYQDPSLARLFHALADPTRLSVVERLCRGDAPVGELARPFAMALPSFLKHVRVLEDAGLVATEKSGRVRRVRLNRARLAQAADWFRDRAALWEGRMDRLGALLADEQGNAP
jgi:DNA-binding transcriptional ArsR family regulator